MVTPSCEGGNRVVVDIFTSFLAHPCQLHCKVDAELQRHVTDH